MCNTDNEKMYYIKKWRYTAMKRWSHKNIEDGEGYKYSDILQADKFKNLEMKEKVKR